MAKFWVRIELHEADDIHYDILHKAMELEGFKRTIEGSQGTYHLPRAEYTIQSDTLNAQQVALLAVEAADLTDRKHSVVAMNVKDIYWAGLEKVKN